MDPLTQIEHSAARLPQITAVIREPGNIPATKLPEVRAALTREVCYLFRAALLAAPVEMGLELARLAGAAASGQQD